MSDYDPSTDTNQLNKIIMSPKGVPPRWGKCMAKQLLFLFDEVENFTAENDRLSAIQAVHDEVLEEMRGVVAVGDTVNRGLEEENRELVSKVLKQSKMIVEMGDELEEAQEDSDKYMTDDESLLTSILEDDPVAALESLFDLGDDEDE